MLSPRRTSQQVFREMHLTYFAELEVLGQIVRFSKQLLEHSDLKYRFGAVLWAQGISTHVYVHHKFNIGNFYVYST